MPKTLVQKSCELLACALGALYAAGCGGVAFYGDSNAGAGGAAAGAGAGGSPTGSSGSSSGGAGTCNVACPDIGCGPGFVPQTQPGQCCPSCVPSGQGGTAGSGVCTTAAACPATACATGFKSVQNPGDCCPTCVPDDASCKKDQASYAALKQMLLQSTDALACKTDADCTHLVGSTQCGDVCSSEPVNVTSAASIDSQLSSYAADHCSTCTAIYPPCFHPPPVICFGYVCTAGGYI